MRAHSIYTVKRPLAVISMFLYCSFTAGSPANVNQLPLSRYFLARHAFVRMHRRTIAMMFVRLSVCLSGTRMHCDHTVHFSSDWSLRLDSPMFWAPNIYDDIVFTMVSMSLSSVTLTFDLKLISTTKPNTSVTKIGWKCFYWFVRYGVVRLTWPWPSTFDPKAKHHIYEPTYNYCLLYTSPSPRD